MKKIPTILGIIILILGVGVGVMATQYKTIFKIGASPDIAPQDVRITNVTDTSLTVTWITDKTTIGNIKWGLTRDSINQTATETDTTLKNIHQINLRGLTPSTKYFFKIVSAGEEFDNNAIPWQAQTGPTLNNSNQNTSVLSGEIVNTAGAPVANALIFVTGVGISPLSAKTSNTGGWIIPLSTARSQDLNTQAQINSSETLLQIFVQAGPLGVSSASIYPQSANPTPQMTLGQTYDFRNAAANTNNGSPESVLEIPEDEDSQSGFKLENEATKSTTQSTVTLESVEEGEVINTTTPEFFGEAPPRTTITILVESEDPITQSIAVPSNGDWSWSPPTDLAPGSHKITISWKDASGVLRQLTRNFIVSAQEGPSFESTPSATKSPSPTPRATVKPTPTASASAKPTATASPSATPRITIPSTEAAIPNSGSLTPTILLSLIGISLIMAAFYISHKAST